MLEMTSNMSSLASGVSGGTAQATAGYGTSLADANGFEQALAAVQSGESPLVQASLGADKTPALQALFRPLEALSSEAEQLSIKTQATGVDGVSSPSPSEVLSLTVQCHQFMFQCQLVSNAANKTSDGLQQLLRQQA